MRNAIDREAKPKRGPRPSDYRFAVGTVALVLALLGVAARLDANRGALVSDGIFVFGAGSPQNISAVSGGTTNATGPSLSFADSPTVTFGINGNTLTASAAGGAGGGAAISAAGASASDGTIIFSNSNGVTFGMNGSTVTATVATNYQSAGAYLTTAALSNHSHGNPTLALTNLSGTTASASNGLTLSLSAGNYLTTAMASNRGSDFVQATAAFAGTSASGTIASNGISVSIGPYITTAALSNHSHGNPTLALTNISGTTASASNGLTLSLSAGNYITTAALSDHSHGNPTLALTNLSGTTASASNGLTLSLSAAAPGGGAAAQSFYMWPDEIANSSAWQVSGSTSHVQPIYIPFPISISYIRLPLTLSCVGSMTSIATAAAVTRGFTVSSTFNVGIYTQGTGASSRSLVQFASGSASWIQRATYQAAAVGSNWSSGHTISYPIEGGNSNFTVSAATTLTNVSINSTQLSNFTGLRHFGIPFATSLPAGAYWLMYGSSTSGSSSGTANVSTLRILASNHVITQVNQIFNLMGVASNSSDHFRQGLGSWTTNAIGGLPASIALANISTSASHPILHFQMIRQA